MSESEQFEPSERAEAAERLRKAIAQLEPIFTYRVLYVGGGNARKIEGKLPANVKIVDNVAGLLGGVRLWQD